MEPQNLPEVKTSTKQGEKLHTSRVARGSRQLLEEVQIVGPLRPGVRQLTQPELHAAR